MNTDIDTIDKLSKDLRAASAPFAVPDDLRPYIAQRERLHQRRRSARLAATMTVAAAALLGGLVWAGGVRGRAATSATQPSVATTVAAYSDASLIYPVIDVADQSLPRVIQDVRATYSFSEGGAWGGAIGRIEGGSPSQIIAVAVFRHGNDDFGPSWAESATPGRSAGVMEHRWGDGMVTLDARVDGYLVEVGGAADDIDTLYEVIGSVRPTTVLDQLAGYGFSDSLPAGLVEVEAPRLVAPFASPGFTTYDGRFDASIDQGNGLAGLAGQQFERVTINGRDGYVFDKAVIITLNADFHLSLSGAALTPEQLLEIARQITFTDEATWNARYSPDVSPDTFTEHVQPPTTMATPTSQPG